jgi:hypothetical protein
LSRVLVLVEEDRDLRTAHVLTAEPTIERLAFMGETRAFMGETRSTSIERVEDPSGFDLVVGRSANAVDVAARIGASAVTGAEVSTSRVPTVSGASLLGCALALAARMENQGADIQKVAIAHPGGPSTGTKAIHFPPPVGRLRGTLLLDQPFEVVVASTPETWASALIETTTGDQALVDDNVFLQAICLAAGIAMVPPAGIVKVWDMPDPYLAKAEEMGLVAAGRSRA